MWQSRWRDSDWRPLLHLAAWSIVVAAIWLGVLPYAGRQPGIESYIRRNEQSGIDPSAKFYTELPLMPSVLERVESLRRREGPKVRQNRAQ